MPVASRHENGGLKEKITESALKGINSNSPDNKYRADDIGYIISTLTGNKLSSVLINDIFNMLFLPVPQLKELYIQDNMDYFETIQHLLKQLNMSGIRKNTVANVDASTVATVNIAANLIKALEEMAQQQGQGQNGSQGQQGGQQQSGQGQGSGQQQGQGSGQQQFGDEKRQSSGGADALNDRIDAAKLLEKLVQEGGISKEDLQKMLNQMRQASAMGYPGYMPQPKPSGNVPKQAAEGAVNGTEDPNESMDDLKRRMDGAGKGAGTLDFNQYDPLAAYLSQKTDIKNLLKLLTGLPNATSSSKEKAKLSRGEYDGYTLGADFKSMAPSAFAYPEELIYALYAHRRLPTYDRVTRENEKTRYVLFDKSGSMVDERLLFAKVVAVSIYLSAMKEKGDFYLTYFDDVVHDKIEMLKNTKRDRKEAMVAFLNSASVSGGTNIENAILAACSDLAKDKSRKTKQIILITDGDCNINESNVKAYLEAAKAELITVYINQRPNMHYVDMLTRVSKRLFLIEEASKDALLKLVSSSEMR